LFAHRKGCGGFLGAHAYPYGVDHFGRALQHFQHQMHVHKALKAQEKNTKKKKETCMNDGTCAKV
jgi:hypothetical protein